MCAAAPCQRRKRKMGKEIKGRFACAVPNTMWMRYHYHGRDHQRHENHTIFREWSTVLASSISCWKRLLHPWPDCHRTASVSVSAPSLRSRVQPLYRLQARTLHAHQTFLCYYIRHTWRPSGSRRFGPALWSLA